MNLHDLGFDSWFEERAAELEEPGRLLVRVTAVERDAYLVRGEHGESYAELAGRLRFEVQTIDRPANAIDGLAMATVGMSLKRMTWARVVESVVERSGGSAPDGVHTEEDSLDDAQASGIRIHIFLKSVRDQYFVKH